MRAALYYAPAPADPLWQAACRWLGRDAESGATLPPSAPPLPGLTEDPRRYGFHATLKPPFAVATSYAAVRDDAAALAASLAPFTLPALHVANLKGFLALRETESCPALHALADACVIGLDRHRAPPSEAELARRRRAPLSPAQEANLVRWGYPYLLDTWFFHMTLTRRLTPAERAEVLPLAEAAFAGLLAPRRVDAVCLFTQASSQAPFLIAERLPLGS